MSTISIYSCIGSELSDNGWQGGTTPDEYIYVPMSDIESTGFEATAYDREDNLVSLSWNSMNGDFCDRLICYKAKIIIKFDIISGEALNKLFYKTVATNLSDSKKYGGLYQIIKNTGHRFFHVVLDSPKRNLPNSSTPNLNAECIYYLGTPTKWSRIGGCSKWTSGNSPTFKDASLYSTELHFIQACSNKINPFNIPSGGGT